jgi:hypothetical protein
MLGTTLGNTESIGVNIEAVSISIYKDYFIVSANQKITGITSKIRIDRKTQDIFQLGKNA